MTTTKVSVLIPIYGVEKYIQRCALSLFSQTMKEHIEFIFVNDATPDNSMALLKEVIERFPERKSQIKIIQHPVNKGLATARITALMAATGEYVVHCDSDDWTEPSMYLEMYNLAKKNDSDIVVCDYFKEFDSGRVVVCQKIEETREEIASSLLRFECLHPFFWIRMIRRSFYLKGEFFADSKISFCEDLAVTIPMHLSTDKVSLLSKPLYHYNVINLQSLTHEKTVKKIESCRLAMDNIEDFIVKNKYYEVLPALNFRRFFYFLPLITNLESYDPHLWLKLDNPNIRIKLVSRSKLSVWLVRHHLLLFNKILQILVRLLFNH